jgi:hypothetical protein
MSNLQNALHELRQRRSRVQQEVEKIDQLISGIESLNGTGGAREQSSQPKRIVSAASRRKMAQAQKARWAAIRNGSQAPTAKSGSSPVKRTMSAASRKKIAMAVRARWAKIRAAKKAA